MNWRLHRGNLLLHMQQKFVVTGSWFGCAKVRSWKLSMNTLHPVPRFTVPMHAQERKLPQIPGRLDFGIQRRRGVAAQHFPLGQNADHGRVVSAEIFLREAQR